MHHASCTGHPMARTDGLPDGRGGSRRAGRGRRASRWTSNPNTSPRRLGMCFGFYSRVERVLSCKTSIGQGKVRNQRDRRRRSWPHRCARGRGAISRGSSPACTRRNVAGGDACTALMCPRARPWTRWTMEEPVWRWRIYLGDLPGRDATNECCRTDSDERTDESWTRNLPPRTTPAASTPEHSRTTLVRAVASIWLNDRASDRTLRTPSRIGRHCTRRTNV
ncbi:hypothetical protein C8Q77DRAFT_863395 [Trametes polyzona]|nr:hypothetical protein C8Q77DRAFT_863395 [Trametes polyzona]